MALTFRASSHQDRCGWWFWAWLHLFRKPIVHMLLYTIVTGCYTVAFVYYWKKGYTLDIFAPLKAPPWLALSYCGLKHYCNIRKPLPFSSPISVVEIKPDSLALAWGWIKDCVWFQNCFWWVVGLVDVT